MSDPRDFINGMPSDNYPLYLGIIFRFYIISVLVSGLVVVIYITILMGILKVYYSLKKT
jgi:hypothetical protein